MNTWKQVSENYSLNKLIFDPQLEAKLLNNLFYRPQPTGIPTVINIIKNLKNISLYVNKIPCKYINKANEITAPYITVIVNTSILTGIVPDY